MEGGAADEPVAEKATAYGTTHLGAMLVSGSPHPQGPFCIATSLAREAVMIGVVLVAILMVVVGLYLVSVDTQVTVQTGRSRPLLRNLGQLLALLGGLCVLGAIMGR